MRMQEFNWNNYCLSAIHYSEDYWHVKIIIYSIYDKSECYEIWFNDCNIENLYIKGDYMNQQIEKFSQCCGINGEYIITISFSGDNNEELKLTCSDYFIAKSPTGTTFITHSNF